jgi:hypothetical protein
VVELEEEVREDARRDDSLVCLRRPDLERLSSYARECEWKGGKHTDFDTVFNLESQALYIHFDPYLRRSKIEIVKRECGKVKQGKAKQEGLG